jgi:antitoxin component HigA of HigAB toxin-antitoxin module
MLFNHLVRKITTAKRAACSTSYLFCHVPPGILVHVTNYEGFGVDQCDLEVNLVGAKSEGAR